MKYFTENDLINIDTLKNTYKKMAFKYHPDLHAEAEKEQYTTIMQTLNAEYQEALKQVQTKNNKTYKEDTQYTTIIDQLIKLKMVNVTIEVCGWFIYLTGETKNYKEKLKQLKCIWNKTKNCWYWKPDWYIKRDIRTWTMEEIREHFGSEIAYKEQETKNKIATI